MGCGLIFKNSNIKSNEIDLSSHIKKLHQQTSTNDTNADSSKTSYDNVNIKDKKEEKNLEIIKKNDKSKLNSEKVLIINNSAKIKASGPIFNILKQTVDKYKMNKSIQ